jgi:hypothetical protein
MVDGDVICTGGCWTFIEGCLYDLQTHAIGTTFNAGDGCNTCTCDLNKELSCTKKACVCDPAAEVHRREYLAPGPGPCVIVLRCMGTTTAFSNACGCGCEQDPSCPEWFDCQPSPDVPPCDTAAIKMKCPYSGIAF